MNSALEGNLRCSGSGVNNRAKTSTLLSPRASPSALVRSSVAGNRGKLTLVNSRSWKPRQVDSEGVPNKAEYAH